ncbi:DNA polymerase III subunit delta' [Herbaspirillum sp. RTI4]|uniref:DNA polymerase III subunit delta' n=1 Tax=Herbaspirillum sp. RTI4 TaxID=3048640 RepID=UPI002AB38B9A|nr:DNA polymerase III subunit delta' [Herbaspirillum sp. RTI4]MDY7579086.1 DNA polymerase III subunit delta' [Herbaspirillum sp. RTI4]MEA9981335.1 DNA polymerase III subunit delta' [Herbaspirillum sp. RTI4]
MTESSPDLLLPWQQESWQQLQQMRARLPHAILFHGAEGSGKVDFAEAFAQSLLCEAPRADGHACGQCGSCGWFAQHNHPDYRRVRPEFLDGEMAADDAEGGEEKKGAKVSKVPSKEIKIDQIRALADFMNISTHRAGMRVVLLYPAEALNVAASNALLKTLEEPPPATVFLLVTHRIDRLLPTVLSRCRKFALHAPDTAQALAWLKTQGVKDADAWLAEQGGAPLLALAAAQTGGNEVMEELLRHLAHPGIDGALKTAERLHKTPAPELVGWMQRWSYDLLSLKATGILRYYPRYRKQLQALANRADTLALTRSLKAINDRSAIASHPLSAKLFVEDMLLDYVAVFEQE